MNFEADDLLDMVDEWKFKLYEKLKGMSQEERIAFWKQRHEEARAAGYPCIDEPPPTLGDLYRRRPPAKDTAG